VKLVWGALGGLVLGVAFLRVGDAICRRRELRPLRCRAVVIGLVTACALGIMHVLSRVDDLSPITMGMLFFAHGTLAAIVIVLAAIDAEHWILPNELTIGGAALAIATSFMRAGGVTSSVAGAAVGLAAALLPWAIYKRICGGSGMGLGDAKLMMLAGAWHGPLGAIVVLFGGALQSVLGALAMSALRRSAAVPEDVVREVDDLRRRAEGGDDDARALLEADPVAAARPGFLGRPLPLGPFLALACIELLFLRRSILGALERFLAN
jgi:leader peptidase (prepilin peptidase) / N-methyltransferase